MSERKRFHVVIKVDLENLDSENLISATDERQAKHFAMDYLLETFKEFTTITVEDWDDYCERIAAPWE